MRILSFILLLFMLTGCVFSCNRVRGNGQAVTEVRRPGSFEGIELHSSFNVEVREGASHQVEVRADKNLLPYIETIVDGDNLVLSTRDRSWLSSRSRIHIIVTAPRLHELRVSGSGDISSRLPLTSGSEVEVTVSGSGTVEALVDAPVSKAVVSGSGDISLRGQTRDYKAHITGSGDIRSYDLASESTEVSVTGSGDAEVYASKRLDISVTGSGDVRYKGKPAITQNKSGSGSVAAAD